MLGIRTPLRAEVAAATGVAPCKMLHLAAPNGSSCWNTTPQKYWKYEFSTYRSHSVSPDLSLATAGVCSRVAGSPSQASSPLAAGPWARLKQCYRTEDF